MASKRFFLLLIVAFALLPLVLPARQLANSDSAEPAEITAPEAAAVLEMVKSLDER